jgi:c(7)-type cytochrome triheme protein
VVLFAALAALAPLGAARARAPVPVPLDRLPADIVYRTRVPADSAVTFSHESHVALEGNRCTGCHPRPFRMLRPTHRANHGEMNAGGSCGSCHDGKRAFGVRDLTACATCHAGRAPASGAATLGAPTPRKGPAPYVFKASESSPGPVRFRHETHRASGCASCHPKPFAMKPPKSAGLAMHESTGCGGCHDGKQSFGVEDVDACVKCHQEGGAR